MVKRVDADGEVLDLIKLEQKRESNVLEMIPSENYASWQVMQAVGSVFMNKYAEGYPGKRYYQGNEAVDKLERLAQDRAKKLFDVPFVNVQPYSGSPANLAILSALCNPGDKILSQHLSHGGHLSMGQTASVTSRFFNAVYYHMGEDGEIDWEELELQAEKHKPKIIFSGGTGYTKIFKWEKYAGVADKVGAYFVADISHIAGLVAGGVHPSPVPWAHVVMTTTHKTLRGPRGAMIMVTDRGLVKDPNLGEKVDRTVFPGIQGGPHMETVAGIAVALKEAQGRMFKKYAVQTVKNAEIVAGELKKRGYDLIGGGTENHMIWINLRNKGIDGWTAAWALEAAGIVVNRQTIPGDQRSNYYPSGLRLGTPALTTRGMKEKEMRMIVSWIDEVINVARVMVEDEAYAGMGGDERVKDQAARRVFKGKVFEKREILEIRSAVLRLCREFPLGKAGGYTWQQ